MAAHGGLMTSGPASSARGAFSLLELVVVIVIIGIVAAIAIPRMSSAAARSRVTSLRGTLATLNRATELYSTEHEGLHPAQDKTGAIDTNAAALVSRLLDKTDVFGQSGSLFGPYLYSMPANPFNGLNTVRIDGAAAGAGTHGWRYDSALRSFAADDSAVTAAIVAESDAVKAVVKDGAGDVKVMGVD
jgi:prepilin-type N-terminal cleavage/methylation domain-containing protein